MPFCSTCCLKNFLLSSPVSGLTFYLQALCLLVVFLRFLLVALFWRASARESRIVAIAAHAVSISARTYPAAVYAAPATCPPICPRKHYMVGLFNACWAEFTYIHRFLLLKTANPHRLRYTLSRHTSVLLRQRAEVWWALAGVCFRFRPRLLFRR